MPRFTKIAYREFYDVPRVFVVTESHHRLLFDCPFDEQLDEYRDTYEVFTLPSSFVPPDGSWEQIRGHATGRLGAVPVGILAFDPTLRASVDLASALEYLGLQRSWPRTT